MSADLIQRSPPIARMSETGIGLARSMEALNAQRAQLDIRIEHVLHAGMYARTAYVPARPAGEATLFTGALIKVSTLLIIEGDALIYTGADDPMRVTGYNVISAEAGRKQVFVALGELKLTMIFPTSAKTVEEAEAEFTDETNLLTTRREAV